MRYGAFNCSQYVFLEADSFPHTVMTTLGVTVTTPSFLLLYTLGVRHPIFTLYHQVGIAASPVCRCITVDFKPDGKGERP